MKQTKQSNADLGCSILAAGAVLGAALWATDMYSNAFDNKNKPTIKAPARNEPRFKYNVVYLKGPEGQVFAVDGNEDGKVDFIHKGAMAIDVLCIADDYRSQRPDIRGPTMTANVREMASEALRLQNELSYELAKQAYEAKKGE